VPDDRGDISATAEFLMTDDCRIGYAGTVLSQCNQWVHCDFFYNVPSQVATGHILNVPAGFFHNLEQNVFSMYLSHSLRFLSQSTQQFVYNVFIQIINDFFESLW